MNVWIYQQSLTKNFSKFDYYTHIILMSNTSFQWLQYKIEKKEQSDDEDEEDEDEDGFGGSSKKAETEDDPVLRK